MKKWYFLSKNYTYTLCVGLDFFITNEHLGDATISHSVFSNPVQQFRPTLLKITSGNSTDSNTADLPYNMNASRSIKEVAICQTATPWFNDVNLSGGDMVYFVVGPHFLAV